MGLLEPPENADDFAHFEVEGPEGAIEVLIDPRFLETHVRDGELLFSIEGHGRFRLHLAAAPSSDLP